MNNEEAREAFEEIGDKVEDALATLMAVMLAKTLAESTNHHMVRILMGRGVDRRNMVDDAFMEDYATAARKHLDGGFPEIDRVVKAIGTKSITKDAFQESMERLALEIALNTIRELTPKYPWLAGEKST